MMALRRKEIYAKYLRSIRRGDLEGFSYMYEQIKHEVTCSVMNWLNIYFMTNDNPGNRGSTADSNYNNQKHQDDYQDGDDQDSGFSIRKDSSETSSTSKDQHTKCGQLSDRNMIKTLFRAGQIWPDWCRNKETNSGEACNPYEMEVYHDLINDRLCVLYQGSIEYPSIQVEKLEVHTSNQMSQQMESLSINTQYFPGHFPTQQQPQQFINIPPHNPHIEFQNGAHISSESIPNAFQRTSAQQFLQPQLTQPPYQFLQPPVPMAHCMQSFGINQQPNPEFFQNGGLAGMGKWCSVPNIIIQ